jgi:hypothetical protein
VLVVEVETRTRGGGNVHCSRASTFWRAPGDKQVGKTLRESQTGSETRQTYTTKTSVKRIEVREPPCQKFLPFVITYFNTLPSLINASDESGSDHVAGSGSNSSAIAQATLSSAKQHSLLPCCIFAVQCSTVLYCRAVGMQPTFTVGTGSFPGVKRPVCGVDHPPLSSVEVKERVGSYLYFPSEPSWYFTG